jgi:hypothetical protein
MTSGNGVLAPGARTYCRWMAASQDLDGGGVRLGRMVTSLK